MTIPTRAELIARVRADYRDELGIDPIDASWETAAASAQAGLAKGLYGRLDWARRQLWPDTADDIYFWRHASILGITAKPAAAWRGLGSVSGSTGTSIPALSQLARSDGQLYHVDATILLGEATVVALTALTAGAAAACAVGQPLTFSPPIAGVAPTCTITETTQSGTEPETRNEAQPRVLARLSDPPKGGSLSDYEAWALQVPGVTRAGASKMGVNSIWIWALRDNDGVGADIIPSAQELVAIETYIATKKPAQVEVDAIALSPIVVPLLISQLIPDTPAVRAAITASVIDFFAREAKPNSTLALSRIDAAISEADGEYSHTLQSPIASVVSAFNQVPILGTVTFV